MDEFEPGPLSDAEIKRLRRILQNDDRMRWFWVSARLWAGWIAGSLAAVWASYTAIRKFVGLDP